MAGCMRIRSIYGYRVRARMMWRSALAAVFPWSLLLNRALETVLLLGVFAAMYRKVWIESGAASSIEPVLVLES